MPNPWVSLRCDQLTPANEAVNKKEQLKKGWQRKMKKHSGAKIWSDSGLTPIFYLCRAQAQPKPDLLCKLFKLKKSQA
jgi:hypothetical protein